MNMYFRSRIGYIFILMPSSQANHLKKALLNGSDRSMTNIFLQYNILVYYNCGFFQEAFYLTDRVMTLSFHKYGNHFFPGTGKIKV